jgi:hypothetical protein
MPDANDLPAFEPAYVGSVSIRDYFATAALQGLLANGPSGGGPGWKQATAELAYELSDGMLRAR